MWQKHRRMKIKFEKDKIRLVQIKLTTRTYFAGLNKTDSFLKINNVSANKKMTYIQGFHKYQKLKWYNFVLDHFFPHTFL